MQYNQNLEFQIGSVEHYRHYSISNHHMLLHHNLQDKYIHYNLMVLILVYRVYNSRYHTHHICYQ